MRIGAARKQPGALAACLMSWARGEDTVDAQAGAFAVAEFIHMIRAALSGKKGKR